MISLSLRILILDMLHVKPLEEQIEQREAMRNPPKFNSDLSLTRSVRVGQQVSISFQATSEFTPQDYL